MFRPCTRHAQDTNQKSRSAVPAWLVAVLAPSSSSSAQELIFHSTGHWSHRDFVENLAVVSHYQTHHTDSGIDRPVASHVSLGCLDLHE
jgi:hypothetical protein